MWQSSGLEKGPRRAHIPCMVIKRGSVWDGIKDAYHLHQAIEALGTLRQSGGLVSPAFAGCHVPASPRQRMGAPAALTRCGLHFLA